MLKGERELVKDKKDILGRGSGGQMYGIVRSYGTREP